MNKLEPYVEYHGNILLKNAINSHSTGLKVQFRLRDEDDLEVFKGITKRRKGKSGQIYRMNYRDIAADKWGVIDVWFLGATWSHNNGGIVAFQMSDVTEWQDFRNWPALSEGKNTEAQELEVILFRVSDSGELMNIAQRDKVERIEKMKGGPQSIRAARLLSDPEFILFCAVKFNRDRNLPVSEKFMNEFICRASEIESKKELDNDAVALDNFNERVMSPFNRWRAEQ